VVLVGLPVPHTAAGLLLVRKALLLVERESAPQRALVELLAAPHAVVLLPGRTVLWQAVAVLVLQQVLVVWQ
jgi:hypothetical protein